jgi:hypothetical protein
VGLPTRREDMFVIGTHATKGWKESFRTEQSENLVARVHSVCRARKYMCNNLPQFAFLNFDPRHNLRCWVPSYVLE